MLQQQAQSVAAVAGSERLKKQGVQRCVQRHSKSKCNTLFRCCSQQIAQQIAQPQRGTDRCLRLLSLPTSTSSVYDCIKIIRPRIRAPGTAQDGGGGCDSAGFG